MRSERWDVSKDIRQISRRLTIWICQGFLNRAERYLTWLAMAAVKSYIQLMSAWVGEEARGSSRNTFENRSAGMAPYYLLLPCVLMQDVIAQCFMWAVPSPVCSYVISRVTSWICRQSHVGFLPPVTDRSCSLLTKTAQRSDNFESRVVYARPRQQRSINENLKI